MTDQDDERSAELLARFQRGDGRAFEELYELHNKSLRGFIHVVVKRADEHWLDELVQKTWVAVMDSARRPEPVKQFRAWLGGIARNICLDELRRRRKDRGTPSPDERDDADADHEGDAALRADLQAAVASLPEEERRILDLRRERDLSFAEIAKEMKIPLTTVNDRFRRALEKIRPRLMGWATRRRKERNT